VGRVSTANLIKFVLRRHRKADGTIFFVDLSRDRMVADGRTLALVVCQDATERLATEDRLRRGADHLARAQRIANTGSVERDFRTQQTLWSDECYRIFGVDRDSFSPSPQALLTLVHPEDRDRVADSLVQSSQGHTQSMTYRIVRQDGAVRMIYREAEVVLDEEGKPLRSISTLRDVTRAHEAVERQKRLEADLRAAKDEAEALARAVQEANADLEQRVEARTAELRAVQDELLKKERLSTLGQLTATVAHELRNPLSAIKNTVFIVKELAGNKGVDIDRPLFRLQRSIDRCNRIISDLLDYSRMPNPQVRVRRFDDWFSEVVAEQHTPAEIDVVLDLQAGATRVRFDPERFRQVVINLFENAIQALTDRTGLEAKPRLRLGTRVLRDALEILIEDNGPGISPENLPRVFEPLFSTKNFGTGLGLPTVKRIVEQHGGDVEIGSTLGEGTKVVMRIPVAAEEIAA
jgi:PAS domain S-box-containing protein